MPAQTNATVTKIAGANQAAGVGGGGSDDWDVNVDLDPDPGGDEGAGKWSGRVRAYYRERTDYEAGAGATDVAVRRELILDTADVDAMGLDTNDVITFAEDGKAATTAVASSIRRTKLDRIPRALQTAKLVLADA